MVIIPKRGGGKKPEVVMRNERKIGCYSILFYPLFFLHIVDTILSFITLCYICKKDDTVKKRRIEEKIENREKEEKDEEEKEEKRCCYKCDSICNDLVHCMLSCCPLLILPVVDCICDCYIRKKYKEKLSGDGKYYRSIEYYNVHQVITREEVVEMAQPGDVIFTGSSRGLGKFIQLITKSNICHVIYVHEKGGVKYSVEAVIDQYDSGIVMKKLGKRLKELENVFSWGFLLPLKQEYIPKIRRNFIPIDDFISEKVKSSSYDLINGMRIWASEKHKKKKKRERIIQINDWEDFMCSELVSKIYQIAEIFPQSMNTSTVVPYDLANELIFEPYYYQFFGKSSVYLDRSQIKEKLV